MLGLANAAANDAEMAVILEHLQLIENQGV